MATEQINQELEDAANKYSDGSSLEYAYMQEIPAFKAGAEWQKEQSATDAIEMLQWICENGWWSSEPMWCNGEDEHYTEITSKQLYELYQQTKICP